MTNRSVAGNTVTATPDIGEPHAEIAQPVGRQAGVFRAMADRDPAAPAILLHQLADLVDIHVAGRRPDIEMDIDIDIEFARQLEDPVDLPGMVYIVTGRPADDRCAAPQRLHNIGVGFGNAGPAFLGEDADFHIHRPAIFFGQLLQRLEAA
jgi:hypothetical protein